MGEVKYASSDGVSIAYRVWGGQEHDRDLVLVPGFVSDVDDITPAWSEWYDRLSSFVRLIVFDKRGTGRSDPIEGAPSFDQRMDDLRAVMDAAGSERATLLGFSEGAPASILFAASHPQRVESLILYGGMAKGSGAPDYPFAAPAEDLIQAATEFMTPYWGQGAVLAEIFAPSAADNMEDVYSVFGRVERGGASPAALTALYLMFLDCDVRHVLPTVSVPTLVLHRRGDRVVSVHGARWMAEQIPGARFVEFPGIDHNPGVGDVGALLDEIETFVTGAAPSREPERVLATVMFTDIVGSTELAADLGDARWREVLDTHHRITREQLARHRGTEVKSTGDGFLATFDGPGRAIACAHALIGALGRADVPIRVGLHTGEVERLDGDDIGGIAVHIAARVGALAVDSEVLASETVKGLVAGSGFLFDDRGEHELKGIPDRWRLYATTPPA